MFDNILNELVIIGHVIVASVLAGLIGLEREISDKPAGLRTNMIWGCVSTDYFDWEGVD